MVNGRMIMARVNIRLNGSVEVKNAWEENGLSLVAGYTGNPYGVNSFGRSRPGVYQNQGRTNNRMDASSRRENFNYQGRFNNDQ